MSSVMIPQDEQLREEITEAQARLTTLTQDLRAIEDELEGLGSAREQYGLLDQVCTSLEQLGEVGASALFWGSADNAEADERIRRARAQIDEFRARFLEIEGRRDAVLSRIREGQEVLDILEDDLLEVELEQEERAQEWMVEREVIELPYRAPIMPWSRIGEEDQRFRKSLLAALLAAFLFGSVLPMIDLPIPDFDLLPEVPERFARLIREAELPPPPPPVELPEPEEELEPEPEPEEPEPILAEELPTEVPEVEQEPAPPVAEEEPEREVRSAGILAFRESFSSLNRPAAQLGSEARLNNAGESAVGRTERSMVTTQGPGSSGGINLSNLSRDVGGGGQGIDGVDVSRVASSIGTGGTADRPLSGGAVAGRTDEEIQIVFDRYKAALYRLYNRELRNNPTLRGQIVLQLTIEPDGSVSFCEVQSSDMGAPTLEQQVAERVLTFDFGAKEDITAITILYPIDFLPAA